MKHWLAALVALFVSQAAAQTSPYTATVGPVSGGTAPNAPVITYAENPPGSDIWDITVELLGVIPSGTAPATVDIEITNSLPAGGIGSLIIAATDDKPFDGKVGLEVNLEFDSTFGVDGDVAIVALRSDVFDTALYMSVSRFNDDVGSIRAHGISGSMTFFGDVHEIFIEELFGTSPRIGVSDQVSITINGDLTGTFFGSGGLGNLVVLGDIGSSSANAVVIGRGDESTSPGVAAYHLVSSSNFFGSFDTSNVGRTGTALSGRFLTQSLTGDVYLGFVSSTISDIALEVNGSLDGSVGVTSLFADPQFSVLRLAGSVSAASSVGLFRWSPLTPQTQSSMVDLASLTAPTTDGSVLIGSPGFFPSFTPGIEPFGGGYLSGGFSQELDTTFSSTSVVEIRGAVLGNATINVKGGFEGEVRIFDQLFEQPDGSFAFQPNLAGQIILDSDASGDLIAGSGRVDNAGGASIILSPFPHYDNLSVELGGGAIGAVPFSLHKTDCNPPSQSIVKLPSGTNLPPVRVRHYGPISLAGAPSSITVERRGYLFGDPWVDITSEIVVAVSSTNPRDLMLESSSPGVNGFVPEYRYRIRPNGAVKCAGNADLDSANPQIDVDAYTYSFQLRTLLDRNNNGMVESNDVAIQIQSPIDVNGDQVANITDLMEVIDAATD